MANSTFRVSLRKMDFVFCTLSIVKFIFTCVIVQFHVSPKKQESEQQYTENKESEIESNCIDRNSVMMIVYRNNLLFYAELQ